MGQQRSLENESATGRTWIGGPVMLTLLFPALVLAIGAFMGGNAYRALCNAAQVQARDAAKRQSAHAAAFVRHCLAQADPLLDNLAALGRRPGFDPLTAQVALDFHDLISARTAVSGLALALADGRYVGVKLDQQDRPIIVHNLSDEGTVIPFRRRFAISPVGELRALETDQRPFNPQREAFFRLAQGSDGDIWTDPAPAASSGRTAVSLTRAVYDTGTMVAVVAVDFTIHGLSQSLAQRDSVPGGTVALLTSNGEILAQPEIDAVDPVGLVHFDEADLPALASLADVIGDLSAIRQPTTVPYDIAGEHFLAAIQPILMDERTTWYITALAPSRSFLGPARGTLRESVIAGSLALLASVIVAYAFARHLIGRTRQAREARRAAAAAERRVVELGAYRLVRRLGVGGMGEVWLGEHQLLTRPAAVKLIQPSALSSSREDSSTVLDRFKREARAMAQLISPNTVRVYDYGVAADDRLYYAMEFLDGIDLDELVIRHGPQSAGRSCDILRQLANSLAEAHDLGLVHRDVKPANVFLCRLADDLDVVKVLDFGMVRHLDEQPAKRLTVEDYVVGTPAYMAPEQARGDTGLSSAADIYSLGCIAFWLLTGRLLFDKPTPMDILVAHLREAPPDIDDVVEEPIPTELAELIRGCLEKEPSNRPPAREVRETLDRIRAQLPDEWTPCDRAAWWHEHCPLPDGASDPRRIANCPVGEGEILTCQRLRNT